MDLGGISSYMMNYYRFFDRSELQIDFAVHGKDGIRDEEIKQLGGRVYHLPTKREDYFGNIRGMKQLFSSGEYQIVHSHMDSMNGLTLKLAQQCGVPIRISHSHNTDFLTKNRVKIALHRHTMRQIPRYATHLWACSRAAGEWLYGPSREFTVIPNAVQTERFRFNPEKREALRREMGLGGKTVIGHVGRFDYQKNQEFLLDVFAQAAKQNDSLRLVLVGDGANRPQIEAQIAKLELGNRVLLLGQRTDVPELVNLFDVQVLPSRFEGLPVTMVEAQANGLTCLCSDCVTREVDVTGNVRFLSLEDRDGWIRALQAEYSRDPSAYAAVCDAGYDIQTAARELQQTYLHFASQV